LYLANYIIFLISPGFNSRQLAATTVSYILKT
jgi:hypothetical protein